VARLKPRLEPLIGSLSPALNSFNSILCFHHQYRL
jgi:hypothetical protein